MLYALMAGILLAVSAASTAALAQGTQNVQPAPLPSPQLPAQSTAQTSCIINCDTQAMNCQNACVIVGPAATPNPAGSAPCNLGCTTQQLVCKQSCTRSQ